MRFINFRLLKEQLVGFKLNDTLKQDSLFIANLELCQCRLMDNSDFPWVILIPMLDNIVEITDLSTNEFNQLNLETLKVARIMRAEFNPDKLNIATLGNVVSQMHVHIVARFKNDNLFPKPVWGYNLNRYVEEDSSKIVSLIKAAMTPILDNK